MNKSAVMSMGLLLSMSLFSVTSIAAESVYDPWEPVNLRVHAFNEFMDEHFLRPAANGYMKYLPVPARRGVSNFFANIGDISVLANNLLQFKLSAAANDTGRIMLNTTVGLGGVLDVATSIGFIKNDEDFGQTLGTWGVGPGPYVVLPLFGPSNLRDSFGLFADTATNPINHQDNIRIRNTAFALEQLDRRVAGLAVDALMLGDPYIFTREAYSAQREYLVTDGEVDESWDDEWDGWD